MRELKSFKKEPVKNINKKSSSADFNVDSVIPFEDGEHQDETKQEVEVSHNSSVDLLLHLILKICLPT